MNPGLLGSIHVTSENSRKYTASYIVYSAYKQSLGYIQIHIHRPSHSNFGAPVWKALKQMFQSLCTLLREEFLQHLLRGTSPFSFKHNSNRLIHDYFIKAINQEGSGNGTAARIRRTNSRTAKPERDIGSLTPPDSPWKLPSNSKPI